MTKCCNGWTWPLWDSVEEDLLGVHGTCLECTGLCLRTANEPVESLRLRVGGEFNTGNIVVGVCNRPLDQDKVDETFRQLEEASCLQIPSPHGGLEPPQYLLEEQHSRAQASQVVSGEH